MGVSMQHALVNGPQRRVRHPWPLALVIAFGVATTVAVLYFSSSTEPARSSNSPNRAIASSAAHSVFSYTTFLPVVRSPDGPYDNAFAYYDAFEDPKSGWYVGPALRYNRWCREDVGCFSGWEEVAYMGYLDSTYRFYVPLTWHGFGGDLDTWFVWPVEFAPLPEAYYPLPQTYCIEATGVFANRQYEEMQPYSAHWGIVFGANAARTEIYTAQVNANHDYAILQYHNYRYPGNRQPLDGGEVNVEIPLARWTGGDHWYYLKTHDPTTLRVVVTGEYVRFYVNGHDVANAYAPGLLRERIGLIGGSWEVTPVDIRIDGFRYEPNCTG